MFEFFMRFRGWIAIIPILIGVGIIFVGTVISEDADRLGADGVEAMATVIGKQEFTRRSTNSATSTDYYVRYHFPLGDGTLHYDRRSVSLSFYEEVEYGVQVPVRFLPADPSLNEIESGAIGENALYAMLIGAVVAFGGILALHFTLRHSRRALHIRDNGVRAEATVEKVVRATGGNCITFTYVDDDGKTHKKTSYPGRAQRIAGVEHGDRIRIRFDPRAPKRAYWERDLGLEPLP